MPWPHCRRCARSPSPTRPSSPPYRSTAASHELQPSCQCPVTSPRYHDHQDHQEDVMVVVFVLVLMWVVVA